MSTKQTSRKSGTPKQKRGPTGYALFAQAQTPKVKADFPDFGTRSKHLGSLWKGLSDEDKKEWNDKAVAMKPVATTPDSTLQKKGSNKRSRKADAESDDSGETVSKKRKRNVDSKSGPKRPRSAYMYFTQQNRADIKQKNPSATFSELAGLVSAAWNKMSAEEKRPYQDMADQDKERYQNEKGALKVSDSQ